MIFLQSFIEMHLKLLQYKMLLSLRFSALYLSNKKAWTFIKLHTF